MVVRLSDFLNTSFSTFSANDTNNTGITYPGAVVHNTTLTPGVGIGAGLDYQVETANNNTETGMRLETVTTDVTAGSEDFDFVVKLMQNGATASEKLRLTSAGNVSVTGVINAAAILINNLSIISTLNGANTAVGAGANAFASATIAGANTAVGAGANNYLLAVIAGANTAVGAGANNYQIAIQNGANTAVGAGANAFASATIAGANTAVGAGANNFLIATLGAANNTPVGNTLSSTFTSRSTRRSLNFIPGSNITINVDDDSAGNRANITIASSASGGGASLTVASDVINATRYIMFANGVSGSIPTLNVSSGMTFNPSTNNFTITGTATATQFNSTSDSSLKTNVVKLHNSIDVLKRLRPVSYNWKDNNKKSYGVIAQELETVLPELVGVSEFNGKKTVNYIPLIAMLIDAIIDLNEKIENNAK